MRGCSVHLYTTKVSSVSHQIIQMHYEGRWGIRAKGRGKNNFWSSPIHLKQMDIFHVDFCESRIGPIFFSFIFLIKMLIRGKKISFTSWPIGYDKLVTPITLGTWELSKWWDHISVWRLWTQSVLRGCLSISLPICSISQAHMKGREGRAGALWRCLGPD